MKLIYNTASPFARKCRILALELGLSEDIQGKDVGAISPLNANEYLFSFSPLGKLPILVINDNQSLCDSRLICEYLLSLKYSELQTKKNEKYFQNANLQVLADGLTEAALSIRYEQSLRDADQQWCEWQQKQWMRIDRALRAIELLVCNQETEQLDNTGWNSGFELGQIAVMCSIGYLDFRFAEFDWRSTFPVLSTWSETHSNRESLQKTKPC